MLNQIHITINGNVIGFGENHVLLLLPFLNYTIHLNGSMYTSCFEDDVSVVGKERGDGFKTTHRWSWTTKEVTIADSMVVVATIPDMASGRHHPLLKD